MSNSKDLKQEIRHEKSKFKTLSFNEKIGYIKDYYTFHILAVLVIIIVAISIYKTYVDNNYNTSLYVALINNDKSVWDDDIDRYEAAMSHSFEEHIGIDGVADRVIVDNNYILNYDKDAEMSVYSAESLVAMIYANSIDIHIGDNLSVDYFCDDDESFFFDLNEIFDSAYLEKYQDIIVYHTFKDNTRIPIGFDVSDKGLIKEAGLTMSPVIISVFSNSEKVDTAIEYVKFILEN